MLLSSIRRGACLSLLAALQILAGSPARSQVIGAAPAHLVDVVEVDEGDEHVDISVQFSCSVRYLTHLPASEGTEVRIQMQPMRDCGLAFGAQIASEVPPVSGGAGILSSVRVDSDAPGQLTLVLDFRKSERFVIAQGVDPRGLRLRLIDRAVSRGSILINQPPEEPDLFIVNLDSEPKAFDPAAVQRAHDRLQAPVFVSETVVDGQTWYRLRAGPLLRRADAEALLKQALPEYPRAWLAIGDETPKGEAGAEGGAAALPPVERIASDPALDAATLKSLLAKARSAMSSHDYPTAITVLTKLQRQPEFPDRARAQELLGLARERAGQLAHAKAEYEEYLRRYPQGEAADRVALRLRTLRSASTSTRPGATGIGPATGWQVSGGFAQLFRYDATRVNNNTPTADPTLPSSVETTAQNALYNDVDLLARRRGETIDFTTRLSAGYAKSFASNGIGDTQRVSIASVELLDRSLGLLARFGRQARNQDGVLGTFDGLFLSYQWRPAWAVNFTVGYPVEQTSEGPQTERRFETLAVEFTPPGQHWDTSIFAATQEFDGVRDRQAVGFEARYLAAHASLIALVDYDTSFKSLNAASLMGTVQLPARWSLNIDAERRNSPVLTTRNALIGQPATTLAQLEQVFTLDQIYQLALDRTPITTDYSLTANRPLGERFQFTATVSAVQTGATIASGGVDEQPASGLDLTYQMQLYSSSLWHTGDFNVITLSYANTEVGKIAALSLNSRFPLAGAWRIGPRLTVDHRTLITDGSSENSLLPSILVDYARGSRLLQFEMGGMLGKRDTSLQTQNTTRYYLSMAYRLGL